MAEPWTRSQIALLRKLWNDDGLTASQCAAVLGVSRNAVIGKVHREKYPKRGVKAARRRAPWSDEAKARAKRRAAARQERAAKRVNPTVARLKSPPMEAFKPAAEDLAVGAWNALPGTAPVELMDLTSTSCRWPIGDSSPFLFCGCQVAEGSSYCPTHKHIGAGKGTPSEQNAVKAAKKAASADRHTRDWLEAA